MFIYVYTPLQSMPPWLTLSLSVIAMLILDPRTGGLGLVEELMR